MIKIKNILTKAILTVASVSLVFSSTGLSTAASIYDNDTQTVTPGAAVPWPEAPEITAESCILIDADTGSILFERNSHERCYPASTTKILTGLLTIENCNMEDVVTFSSQAANSINPAEDANLGTRTGEQYSVEQALYGLLLYSANEIAYGLAEHVAGSLPAFVDMMNKKAVELGATETHFANASGLYDANHFTTAYDMAMIARGCYNNASFVSIDSTSTNYSIPPTNITSSKRTFKHRHKMLEGREFYYEYCKGGKTGFTDESQYTLVTFAEKDGMRLICVTFKEPDDATRFVDTKTLFDWGFNNFQKSTTTGSQLGSMFSTDNYYNSAVFSKMSLNFGLNASFITIPNKGSLNNVSMDLDDQYKITNENGVMTAHLKFLYGDNTVGTTSLSISGSEKYANSMLPYVSAKHTTEYKPKTCIKINIWFIVGAYILVFVIIYVRDEIKRIKRQKHHYNRAKRRRRR